MLVSIVVPVYNEEASLQEFYRRLVQTLDALPYTSEVWFVDDGSADTTAEIIRSLMKRDTRIGLLELSRNFGHQAALTAGLDFANGDVVISMDGDGQHPPELIPQLLALHERGFDVVLTQRRSDKEDFLKRWTSRTFYWLIGVLSSTPILPASSDFRCLSRQVVLGLRQVREHHRFLRGLISWMGFRWTMLAYDPAPRIAGTSKYSVRKMSRLAFDAVFSFSAAPMKIAILIGVLFLLLAFWQLSGTIILISQGRRSELVPGWTSLIFSILGVAGVQLIMLGVIGQYVAMIFQEVKKRPLYFLRRAPTLPTTQNESAKTKSDE